MNATQRLAEFTTLGGTALPAAARARAVRLLLDTLAVALAGHREPGPQALHRALRPSGEAHAVALPWCSERYAAEDACLLFGTASHALDYDDVSMIAVCHPSVPVVTVLAVLAQQVAASGARFIDAFATGTEVLLRCGEALGFRHYELGFHPTGTLGTLGAAAAAARLLGLTPAQTAHALSIGASMSSGIQKNFGTMVKSLHVGLAAANGLRAARLAQCGIEAAADAFEGRGWLYAYSGGAVERWPEQVVLGAPYAIEQPGFEQKRYPCCYMTHKMIKATLALRQAHGLTLDMLEGAVVRMPRGGSAPLIHPRPANGLAAKFSGQYAVAAALEDGRINLASFEDAAVLRPQIQAALGKVTLTEAEQAAAQGSEVGAAPVSVTLATWDGRRFEHTVTIPPGSPQDPLSDQDLLEKWQDCFARAFPGSSPQHGAQLFHAGLSFDEQESAAAWLRQVGPGR